VLSAVGSAPRPQHSHSLVAMADSYDSVIGGALKLKGITKKKKKKRTSEDGGEASAAASSLAAAATSQLAAPSYQAGASEAGHTASELRRLQTMQQRKFDELKQGKVKSHRERVKDFNSYLGNLTEHYDLPKVSKGN
jgi:protein FAM32A